MKSHSIQRWRKATSFATTSFVALLPLAALAAPRTFNDLVNNYIIKLVNDSIIPLIFTLAFIVFIWGVFRYFFFPTEANKTAGRDLIVWGLLGMFVMISVWGLVNVVIKTFSP